MVGVDGKGEAREREGAGIGRGVAEGTDDRRQRARAEPILPAAAGKLGRSVAEESAEDHGPLVAQGLARPDQGGFRGRGLRRPAGVQERHNLIRHHAFGSRDEAGSTGSAFSSAGAEFLELRDDLVAERSAETGGIAVGGIISPHDSGLGAKAAEVGGIEIKGGADEADGAARGARHRSRGGDAAQAAGSAAAKEGHEEGLELVLGVVAGGDEMAAVPGGERREGLIAEAAGGGLGVAPLGPHGDGGLNEGEAECFGECGGGVAVGESLFSRAEVVHDVGDRKDAAGLRHGRGEAEGEADRVAAAGAGEYGAAAEILPAGAATGEVAPGEGEVQHRRVPTGNPGGSATGKADGRRCGPCGGHQPMIGCAA
jgi:hypothetical protein